VVQKLADEFRVLWYKAVGSTQGLFIHLLHEHLVGDLHTFRKEILRHLTNRQKKLSKYNRNRVAQSMSAVLCRKVLQRRDSTGTEEKEY
jgi:hypothetical protein